MDRNIPNVETTSEMQYDLETLSDDSSLESIKESTFDSSSASGDVRFSDFLTFTFVIISNFFLHIVITGLQSLKTIYFVDILQFSDIVTIIIIHSLSSLKAIALCIGLLITDNLIERYNLLTTFSASSVIATIGIIISSHFEITGLYISCIAVSSIANGLMNSSLEYIYSELWMRMTRTHTNVNGYFCLYFLAAAAAVIGFVVFPWIKSFPPVKQMTGFTLSYLVLGIIASFLFSSLLTALCSCIRRGSSRGVSAGTIYLIVYSLSVWQRKRKIHPEMSFLDCGKRKFKIEIISNTKKLFSVYPIILPFPVIWAAFNQISSTWTLQARKLDGTITSHFSVLPEQVQAVNAILKVTVVALIYCPALPCLKQFRFRSLLNRIVTAYFFAALSYFSVGLVEQLIYNNSRVDTFISAEESRLRFINLAPCDISLHIANETKPVVVSKHEISEWTVLKSQSKVTINASGTCISKETKHFDLKPSSSYTLGIDLKEKKKKKIVYTVPYNVKPILGPYGLVQFIVSRELEGKLVVQNKKKKIIERLNGSYSFNYEKFSVGKYQVSYITNGSSIHNLKPLNVRMGVCATLAIWKSSGDTFKQLYTEDIRFKVLSIVYLIPQYILIAVGEMCFYDSLMVIMKEVPEQLEGLIFTAFLVARSLGDIIVTIAKVFAYYVQSQIWDSYLFAMFLIATGMINGQTVYQYLRKKEREKASRTYQPSDE